MAPNLLNLVPMNFICCVKMELPPFTQCWAIKHQTILQSKALIWCNDYINSQIII